MTDTRHTQPRCPICRWPYRVNKCKPFDCRYRPDDGTPEYVTQGLRLAAWDRLYAPGNPAPTIEDVDAELQPEGLPVIELDGPTWIGGWGSYWRGGYMRYLLLTAPNEPSIVAVHVARSPISGLCGVKANRDIIDDSDHPTPEAAQAACEAAIIAAWRNR